MPDSGPGLSFGTDDITPDWPGHSQPTHAADDPSGGPPPDGTATGRTRPVGAPYSDDDGDRTARGNGDDKSGSDPHIRASMSAPVTMPAISFGTSKSNQPSADTIGPANEQDGNGALVTLHFDGLPEAIETDIAGDHKIFRCRGPWKQFFAHHHLAEGDSVAIERLSAYEYHIVPAR